MNLTKVSLCTALVLGGVVTGYASSFVIVKPTVVTAVYSPSGLSIAPIFGFPYGFQFQSITNIINGSGLSSALNTGDAVPGAGFWPTHSVAQNTLWVADYSAYTQLTWTVTLTLGSTNTLSGFHLWNENEDTLPADRRGSSNYTVSVSTDGSLFTPITASPTPFLQASGLSSYQGDDYSFTSPVSASYVRFTIASDYGSIYGGLSEIRFIEAIPEPSTFMLLGLGGLLVWRRARKSYTDGN
jgi:F5/8 type C domain/PEP-CTERM motif